MNQTVKWLLIIIAIILLVLVFYYIYRKTETQNLIILTYNKALGRDPKNEDTSQWEAKLQLKGESFIAVKPRSLKEKLTSYVDPTKTTEYLFWENVLNNKKITPTQFLEILNESDERIEKLKEEIRSRYLYLYHYPANEVLVNKIIDGSLRDFDFTQTDRQIVYDNYFEEDETTQYIKSFVLRYFTIIGKIPSEEDIALYVKNFETGKYSETMAIRTIPSYLKPIIDAKYLALTGRIYDTPESEVIDMINRGDISDEAIDKYLSDSDEAAKSIITGVYETALYRKPTEQEAIDMLMSYKSTEKLVPIKQFVDDKIRNSPEYQEIGNKLDKTISETYINMVFKQISTDRKDEISNAFYAGKVNFETLPDYIMTLEEYGDRENNLNKLILEIYTQRLGRVPSNIVIDYWTKQLASKGNIPASEFSQYTISDMFYNASALNVSTKNIYLFSKHRIDEYSTSENKIVGSITYSDFIPERPNLGETLLCATESLTTDGVIWLFESDDTFSSYNYRDKTIITNKKPLRESDYFGGLSGLGINVGIMNAMIPHPNPERKNEVMIFLASGNYMVWDIVEKRSRFNIPISESKVDFPAFPFDARKIGCASRLSHSNWKVMFVNMDTNEMIFWDLQTGKQI